MLKIENLTKSYNEKIAVCNLSLEVKKGEIFGFIGPNGAGKSTTIKCILNLINKDEGLILVNDKKIDLNYVGYLPSEVELYEDLTVEEMFEYAKSFYLDKQLVTEKTEYLTDRFNIELDKKIGELSLGNKKKVGIVLSLMHNPSLVIMDEPTSGLDPVMQEVFFEVLKAEKKNGTTIFLSSHNLNEVKKICDRVAMIKDGKLIFEKSMSEINNHNAKIVTLTGREYKKLKLPIKDITIKNHDKNTITFIYKGDINELLKILPGVKLDNILIEEPTLEEIFLSYYRGDKNA